ncbi:MAG: alpha-mannosidase [Candidatus Thorarchaeota archaeon]
MSDENIEAIVISETHWDRAWYRTFEQFRLRLVRLVDRLMDILESDEEFTHFTFDGQTIVLEDYLEVKPQNRSRLKRLIESGRIIIGPWYVLPDVFLVSGEALIRNLLMGRYVAKDFGPVMRVGYIPDPFGHVSQLPMILSQFGYDSVIFARGTGDEVDDLGSEFIWEATDGSEVLAHWLPLSYGNIANLAEDVDDAVSMIDGVLEQLRPWSRVGTCLLMNGSDHLEPQPHLPAVIRRYNETHDKKIVLGTLPMFVERLRERRDTLKRFRGEFRRSKYHNLLSGVYSARVYLKQANDACQRLLEHWVEPFCVLAGILGMEYPQDEIRQAWKYLLRNHPHDDICGCSIDEVHDDMVQRFRWVQEIGNDLLERAMTYMGSQMGPQGLGVAIFNPIPKSRSGLVVFDIAVSDLRFSRLPEVQLVDPHLHAKTPLEAAKNEAHVAFVKSQGFDPSPSATREIRIGDETLTEFEFDFTGLVMLFPQLRDALRHLPTVYRVRVNSENRVVEVWVRKHDAADAMSGHPVITDDTGRRVPMQVLKSFFRKDPKAHLVADTEEYLRVAFLAEAVPGLGAKKYSLSLSEESPAVPENRRVSCTDDSLENSFVRVTVNSDGTVSLYDKRTNTEYAGLLLFEDTADIGDEYDYCPLQGDVSLRFEDLEVLCECVDDGPLIGTLRVSGSLHIPAAIDSGLTARSEDTVLCDYEMEISVYSGSPVVRVRVELDNQARDHRLRMLFPTYTESKTCFADSTFDIIERPVRPTGGPDWYQPVAPTYPMRSFAALLSEERGLVVCTRGLVEFEVLDERGGTIALTLLRSVGWLSRAGMTTRRDAAGPVLETPGAQCIGTQVFEFAVVPTQGPGVSPDLLQTVQEYLLPMAYVLAESSDSPDLALIEGVEVEPSAVMVSALKIAEDGSGWVLRLWNTLRGRTRCTIRVGVSLSACDALMLDETPDDETEVSLVDDHTVCVEIPGRGLVTLRLVLAH